MGNAESGGDGQEYTANAVLTKLPKIMLDRGRWDYVEFKKLWKAVEIHRRDQTKDGGEPRGKKYELELVNSNIMKYVKDAFRHPEQKWREEGIKMAKSFLHIPVAREKLRQYDFISSLLLITLPKGHAGGSTDDEDDGEGEGDYAEGGEEGQGNSGKETDDEQNMKRLEKLAAEVVCEMASYPEFTDQLCETSVLNFLCVVLNKRPEGRAMITSTLMKLAGNDTKLSLLVEGAVNDILESYFKTVPYLRPVEDDDNEVLQWEIDVQSLGHTAHTLGTFIKYNHTCNVDRAKVITVMDDVLRRAKAENPEPDNVRLQAELARLFYWCCRRSRNVVDMLASKEDDEPDSNALPVLSKLWKWCILRDRIMEEGLQALETGASVDPEFTDKFLMDDLRKDRPIDARLDDPRLMGKVQYQRMRLAYINCTFWLFIPIASLRWKLRDLAVSRLHHVFSIRDEEYQKVALGTVRYLIDSPTAHECTDFIEFLGDRLMQQLHMQLQNMTPLVILLLDSISLLAMQRAMQVKLAEADIHSVFQKVKAILRQKMDADAEMLKDGDEEKANLYMLRTLAQVAVHPQCRLPWVDTKEEAEPAYPPREEFELDLQEKIKDSDENFSTIASLLLTIFQEQNFDRAPEEIENTFRSITRWWAVNTTARFEDERDATEIELTGGQRELPTASSNVPLKELLRRAIANREAGRLLTTMESQLYCSPHECVLALSLFSRLALEPSFKSLFREDLIESLLGCICSGIWPEAREAAATLANLMWLPDDNREFLVCWLKFDGPNCIAVDAANVLLPVKTGNPKPADMGKGMYRSSWGIEFVTGSCITLHPDGLRTHRIPATLTCASPMDTFATSSRKSFQFLAGNPDIDLLAGEPTPEKPTSNRKLFTITCWFHWPPKDDGDLRPSDKVLVQSSPSDRTTQIYLDCSQAERAEDGVWTIVDHQSQKKIPMRTPRLEPGWHMLSLVSSTSPSKALHSVSNIDRFDGTKFYLDDWSCTLTKTWIKNDFYLVGNSLAGSQPFGLIADFRIYARPLSKEEICNMVATREVEKHPDQIARKIARMEAVKILTQRVDVPDSAAECLRALGSLATLSSERAQIFSECGAHAMRLVDSPLPNIQRQASRLLNNIK